MTKVTVKVVGGQNAGATRRAAGTFDLHLRDGVTAGELLHVLAERCGPPFHEALESTDPRLPRHIRMFADGEMLVTRKQALAPGHGAQRGVTVVLLRPMMGG